MTPTGTVRRASRPATGHVRVLLFGTARTTVGSRSLPWPVGADGATVRELVAELGHAFPRLGPILAHSRFFHDGVPVGRTDERVRPGEELAVHPPYGGG